MAKKPYKFNIGSSIIRANSIVRVIKVDEEEDYGREWANKSLYRMGTQEVRITSRKPKKGHISNDR